MYWVLQCSLRSTFTFSSHGTLLELCFVSSIQLSPHYKLMHACRVPHTQGSDSSHSRSPWETEQVSQVVSIFSVVGSDEDLWFVYFGSHGNVSLHRPWSRTRALKRITVHMDGHSSWYCTGALVLMCTQTLVNMYTMVLHRCLTHKKSTKLPHDKYCDIVGKNP